MKRYRIFHETRYLFTHEVILQPHTLRLRPREGHELRIESATLDVSPAAKLRWHRDAEGNSVAIASFSDTTRSLCIGSEVVIQQYAQLAHDFLIEDYAVDYPFSYRENDRLLLMPYLWPADAPPDRELDRWLAEVWEPGTTIQLFALLLELNQRIYEKLSYQVREEEGVQLAAETLRKGSGSCRDSASLFIAAARRLGFAARFVSGYLCPDPNAQPSTHPESTHAWAEVFIPGAGWRGFDSSHGALVGAGHIAVDIAMSPESVPPVSGSFQGPPGATMVVNVRVTELS